jgi:hypothetical protein
MSPRSGRQHKAWGGASKASGTPGTGTINIEGARGEGDRPKDHGISTGKEFIEFLQANGMDTMNIPFEVCRPLRRLLLLRDRFPRGLHPGLYAVVRSADSSTVMPLDDT